MKRGQVVFLFKKIVAPLFFPLSICLQILLLGLLLLWFTRRQKTGKVLVTIGSILLALLSFSPVPNKILHRLEYKYPAVLNVQKTSGVNWIVVLGGGHTSDPKLPATSQISGTALTRLIEGIRLQRMLPGSKLVLSGGGAFDPVPESVIMARIAQSLGVKKQGLILESLSKDTKDEARLIKDIVGNDKFFLVTSASHMPRSMAIFKKGGMHPIPAPTGHLVKEIRQVGPGLFFPSPWNLVKSQRAVYEYLGLVWAKIRGLI